MIRYSMAVLQMVLTPPEGLPRHGFIDNMDWCGSAAYFLANLRLSLSSEIAMSGMLFNSVAVQLSQPLVSFLYLCIAALYCSGVGSGSGSSNASCLSAAKCVATVACSADWGSGFHSGSNSSLCFLRKTLGLLSVPPPVV